MRRNNVDIIYNVQFIDIHSYLCRCKNFFKRSVVVVQKKPYVCPNQRNCDVRIVYDKSGLKRKGARCQYCRYTACLDQGMSHPGTAVRDPDKIIQTIINYHFKCRISASKGRPLQRGQAEGTIRDGSRNHLQFQRVKLGVRSIIRL